jgi:hypothetical protein
MHPYYPVMDTTNKSLFRYEQNGYGLTFEGSWRGDSVKIRMEKKDGTRFRLINRGFHWINEAPYHY